MRSRSFVRPRTWLRERYHLKWHGPRAPRKERLYYWPAEARLDRKCVGRKWYIIRWMKPAGKISRVLKKTRSHSWLHREPSSRNYCKKRLENWTGRSNITSASGLTSWPPEWKVDYHRLNGVCRVDGRNEIIEIDISGCSCIGWTCWKKALQGTSHGNFFRGNYNKT